MQSLTLWEFYDAICDISQFDDQSKAYYRNEILKYRLVYQFNITYIRRPISKTLYKTDNISKKFVDNLLWIFDNDLTPLCDKTYSEARFVKSIIWNALNKDAVAMFLMCKVDSYYSIELIDEMVDIVYSGNRFSFDDILTAAPYCTNRSCIEFVFKWFEKIGRPDEDYLERLVEIIHPQLNGTISRYMNKAYFIVMVKNMWKDEKSLKMFWILYYNCIRDEDLSVIKRLPKWVLDDLPKDVEMHMDAIKTYVPFLYREKNLKEIVKVVCE